MGESIAWGSDSEIMREAAKEIEMLTIQQKHLDQLCVESLTALSKKVREKLSIRGRHEGFRDNDLETFCRLVAVDAYDYFLPYLRATERES